MAFLSTFVTDCINGTTFLIWLMSAFPTSINNFTFDLEFSLSSGLLFEGKDPDPWNFPKDCCCGRFPPLFFLFFSYLT